CARGRGTDGAVRRDACARRGRAGAPCSRRGCAGATGGGAGAVGVGEPCNRHIGLMDVARLERPVLLLLHDLLEQLLLLLRSQIGAVQDLLEAAAWLDEL